MPELLIIAAIAGLIFGPRQLPKLGRSIGESIREFRGVGKELAKGWSEAEEQGREIKRDLVDAERSVRR